MPRPIYDSREALGRLNTRFAASKKCARPSRAGSGGRSLHADARVGYSQTVKRKAFESPVVNEAWGSRIQNCAWTVSPTLIDCCV